MNALIADNNEISKIDLKSVFIRIVDISHNKLSSLNVPRVMSIENMDISYNPTLKKYGFLKNLIISEKLKMRFNKITDLSKTLSLSDDNDLKLESLDISGNLLASFDFESLKNIINLQSIDISGNNLAFANFNGLKESYLYDLEKVELSGNPWNCTELKSLINHFKANLIYLQNSKDFMEDTNLYEMYVSGVGCYLNGTSKVNLTPADTEESTKSSLYLEFKEMMSKFENKAEIQMSEFENKLNENTEILTHLRKDFVNDF
ncbi:hypothetical protein ACFFRR_004563 [Megaselia abdita]